MKKKLIRSITLILPVMMISLLSGCSKSTSSSTGTDPLKKDVSWTFKTDPPLYSSPVIFENDIIIGSNAKILYSINSTTQEKTWSFESDGIIDSTPVVDGNTIIFSSKTTCYALDGPTGNKIWNYTSTAEDVHNLDEYDFHSPSPIIYKDSVIFTSKSGSIYSLNKATGALEWEYKADGCGKIITTPSIQDNIMCFGDANGTAYAMDLDTQTTLWTNKLGNEIIHTAFTYKDYAYFGGRDTKLVAYNLKDGAEKWSYTEVVKSWLTADIIVNDDILYVGGSDNKKVDTFKYDTGEYLKSYSINANMFSKPVIDNNILYSTFGDVYGKSSGGIIAYDLATDEKVLECIVDKTAFSSPVVLNNVVYFGSTGGNLNAVDIITE